MTPEQLKTSILLNAIQGKLVKQCDNETCCDIKSSFQGETIDFFDIPTNWKWLALKDVVTINTGLAFKKQDQKNSVDGTLRILRGGNIGDDYKYHLYDDDIYVDYMQFQDKYLPLQVGDVIMPSVTSMEKMCKTGYIDVELGKTTAGGFVYVIRAIDASVLDSKYLLYYISSSFNKEQCKPNIHKSGQAFYNLKKSGFIEQPICIPPIEEQHRIVDKIEELLPFVERYAEAYKKLEQFNAKFPEDMKKSILQYAIQGKLVEQRPEEGTAEDLYKAIQEEKQKLIKEGKIKKEKPLAEITEDEIPFDIPESWKWVRLSGAALVIVDCPHSTPNYLTSEGDYYAIDTNCIDANGDITGFRYVDITDYSKRIERLEPEENDIVYTREGSICRAAILPGNKKICLGQRVMLIRCPEYLDAQYLKRILMAPQTVSTLTSKQKGLGAKHVNVSDVCNLVFPLPPIGEQYRIVEKIDELLPFCNRLSERG